jgi:hypothetical protein
VSQSAEKTDTTSVAENRDEVLLSWVAHPARRSPGRLIFAVVVMLAVVIAARVGMQSTLLAVVGLVTLLVATAPFLLPTRYTLTRRGIIEERARARRERPWSQIRRVHAGPGAMLLSPYRRTTWLERHRGLLVLFDGADRALVLETTQRCVAEGAAAAAQRSGG